jgi:ribonucleotide reductase alpha subunit
MQLGKLQFDMWDGHAHSPNSPIGAADWERLRADIENYGVRNSMLIAPMPTASTAQIFGNNECFEPYTSNIYTRRTMAGEFVVVNKHMVKELIGMGMWSEELKDNIIANRGSVQQIQNISDEFKTRYRTVWEVPMRSIIDMARDRGAYICQSQSMNLWVEDPQYSTLTAMHFYGWKEGLKTGIYYLRRKPKHHPQQFTIEPPRAVETADAAPPGSGSGAKACPFRPRRARKPSDEVGDALNGNNDDDDECLMCGS